VALELKYRMSLLNPNYQMNLKILKILKYQ
jgi:hypothetical protein